MRKSFFVFAVIGLCVIAGPARAHEGHAASAAKERRAVAPAGWWKGNTHTHTWWSDGDSPPESVAGWYRERDYNFLVLSDHNRMQEGEFWYRVDTDAKREALKQYREKQIAWPEYEREFLALMIDRRIESLLSPDLFAAPTVLLCSEHTPDRCHRRLVAEYLQDRWGNVTIRHL